MSTTRRGFLSQGAFTLAGVTAGVISLSSCGSTDHPGVQPGSPTGTALPASAGFGWSVNDFNSNSACAYFRVADSMILQGVTIDAALQPAAITTAGAAQALCRGWVSRGGLSISPNSPSADFGAVSIYNPGELSVTSDAAPMRDLFFSAILRSWIALTGVDSTTARSVSAVPVLALNAGDYLVFGIEQQGVGGGVHLQATLSYQTS